MAVTGQAYNIFKTGIMSGSYTLDKDAGSTYPVFCALVNNSYTFDADHKFRNEVVGTYEITGTAYTAGGAALSSPEVTQDDTNDKGVFDAEDCLWGNATITARGAVLYSSTGSVLGTSDPLIAFIDFGTDEAAVAGNFVIQWAAEGIVNIT